MTDSLPPPPPPPAPPPPPPSSGQPPAGFDFNRPTIIALLYLLSPVTGVTGIAGIVLSYVWKNEPHGDWEASHYQYLINTFWLGLAGTIIGFILLIVLIGAFIMLAAMVLVVVRCILSLINAQKRQPMPNPATWLA